MKEIKQKIKNSLFSNAIERDVFLIVGAGGFGSAIAKELASLNQKVIVIDKEKAVIDEIASKVDYAQVIDATKRSDLSSLDFSSINHVVISLGHEIDNTILSTLNIMSLLSAENKKNLTVKCSNASQQLILTGINVPNIIYPEMIIAKRTALALTHQNVDSIFYVGIDHCTYSVEVRNTEVVDKTVSEIENLFDNKIMISLISKGDGEIIPKKDTKIEYMESLQVFSLIDKVSEVGKYFDKKKTKE